MSIPSSITEQLRSTQPTVSIEFFPPKTEEGARQILKTAHALKDYGIAFASITYGAGGSTRERTIEYGELLNQFFGYNIVPHLTCVGHSRDELAGIIDKLAGAGFSGIMALRGDPPKGESSFTPHANGLPHASDLVSLIRERCGKKLAIGVAGYPENHPESPDMGTDMRWLSHKVAQGADFITTQLFFDNADYFSFVNRCNKAGITVPILPGILPLSSLEQARKFSAFGKTRLPEELESRLAACAGDSQLSHDTGVEWAFEQVRDLLAQGAPGFHLYILNRAESALALFARLQKEGILKQPA
ncbi:MAG: methylenetetrahydrofolate reductase [NAD(P)H] [Puniceicoccales bacterium]|jgi:methylenetetrahydrofolate reductase (NADPH)|nr:methylenetetrahydrofolate reductase [NAD(P)H] [Puniceicoccales bacterium]